MSRGCRTRRSLSGDNVVSRLMEAGCFRYRDELEYRLSYALRLKEDNVVSMLMEADCFRYEDELESRLSYGYA